MFSQSDRNSITQFLARSRDGYHQEVEIRFSQLTDENKLEPYSKQSFTGLLNQMKKVDPTFVYTYSTDRSYDENPRKEFRERHFNNTIITVTGGEKTARTKLKFEVDKIQPNINYGYSIGLAYEKELSVNDPLVSKPRGPSPNIRDKYRHSFMMNGNRLDMTRVSNAKEEKYEIEFELLDPTDLDRYFKTATQIYMMLNDTLNLYTLIEKREAFREVNLILRHGFDKLVSKPDLLKDYKRNRIFGTLDMEHLVQARNLKSDDLAYGGLIPPPFIDQSYYDSEVRPTEKENIEIYTVTHKADGFRKLLYINEVGLWLLMSRDANLIARMSFSNEFLYNILDGELIPYDKRRNGAPNTPYWYLIFDNLNSTITTDSMAKTPLGLSIQQNYHYRRLAESEVIAQKLTNDIITIETKSFKAVTNGNNPYSFFEVMRKMFNEQEFQQFETDGFMFTPVRSPYMIKTENNILERFREDKILERMNEYERRIVERFRKDRMIHRNVRPETILRDYSERDRRVVDRFRTEKGRYPRDCNESYDYISRNRKLTKYVDICKWKPPALMTVDLALKWVATREGKKGLELYAKNTNPYTSRETPYVLFGGTQFNPFRGGMIEITKELLDLPSWTVVEFAWDEIKQKLVIHKVRLDKTYPNGCEVAMDVWDITQRSSVTKETLMGMSFDMVRRYHNQIKSSLFYANKVPGGILLDIGSGRGGDIHKWKPNFNEIIAVEPNREHIDELSKRVTEAGMSSRVSIVPTGGEDYETITDVMDGRKADVISMMLSMSFFWNIEQPDMLESLAKTIVNNIAPNGKLIFMTQDGRALSEMFLPSFSGLILTDELKLGPATIKVDGYTVDIHIDETIVQHQREYLVFIYDLVTQINLLTSNVAKLEYFTTAFADDRFMTEAEQIYSQIFASGVISFGQSEEFYKNFLIKNFDISKMSESKIPYTTPSPARYDGDGTIVPVAVDPNQIDDNGKALGDDALTPITVQGYKGSVYTLGTIGDGSCFFHALFKAIYPDYQDDARYKRRRDLVSRLRAEFAILLLSTFKGYTKSNYYLVNNGKFNDMYEQQKIREESILEAQTKLKTKLTEKQRAYYQKELKENLESIPRDLSGTPIDYAPTKEGIFRYIYSNRDVGDDVIAYVTNSKPLILNTAVIVIECTKDGCRYIFDTIDPTFERYVAVIHGNGYHYETVAVERVKENGDIRLSTFFYPDDPFILSLLKLKKTK